MNFGPCSAVWLAVEGISGEVLSADSRLHFPFYIIRSSIIKTGGFTDG